MLLASARWLWGYLKSLRSRAEVPFAPRHLLLCVADHFEPFGYRLPRNRTFEFLKGTWLDSYPWWAGRFPDSDGVFPRHTFFFAADQYDPEYIDRLGVLCRDGWAELEIHLHHEEDTRETLRGKIESFRDALHRRHGMLGLARQGSPRYGFIHGNWALCNSRPDGKHCGVNEELSILAETGCYADFTFPSAPDPTQPRMVNAVYRAWDRPEGRGQDTGVRCRVSGVGSQGSGVATRSSIIDPKSLMLIQGPLALNWRRRRWGFVPQLDCGGIEASNPPSSERMDLWVRQHVHVVGRPEWVFVKMHMHGAVPGVKAAFFDGAMREVHEHLRDNYKDGKRWCLHYVSAREMYNIARAAEDGLTGNPGDYRDYEVKPPQIRRSAN